MLKKVCYLAGGFYTDWQEQTMFAAPNLDYFDPKTKRFVDDKTPIQQIDLTTNDVPLFDAKPYKESMTVNEYRLWDLYAIRNSNIVFLYHEKSSPGFADCMEAAYAKGLGKTVIVCTELENEKLPDRYIAFVEVFADIVFHDIADALKFLKTL